jgi:uncharacterized protein with PIN domain
MSFVDASVIVAILNEEPCFEELEKPWSTRVKISHARDLA